MAVDPHTASYRHNFEGRPYYFCSAECRDKFVAEPKRYVQGAPASTSEIAADTIYTCPMHLQVRQRGPGSCPICGMALEPELGADESGPSPELKDMTQR